MKIILWGNMKNFFLHIQTDIRVGYMYNSLTITNEAGIGRNIRHI